MKINRISFIVLIMTAALLQAQKKKKDNYNDIIASTDIIRIEKFLKDAHPEDPRRAVMKSKLITLKNKKWTEGAKNAKPMEARPIITEVPNNVTQHTNSNEAEEFKKLIAENTKSHSEKTAQMLTTLFSQDIKEKEAILLVQNQSDCDIIVRLQGDNKNFYNLAVPKNDSNHSVINKGKYSLTSIVCGVNYTTSKDISKGTIVTLNNPTITRK